MSSFNLNSGRLMARCLIMLGAAVSLASCSTLQTMSGVNTEEVATNTFTLNDIEATANLATYTKSKPNDFFKVGDTAEVTVHGFEEFSGNFSVDRAGELYFAHIGAIDVVGLTVADLQQQLRQRYEACCLKDPSVSVKKESQTLGRIVVDGAVTKPGSFDLAEPIKLSEAIALAGGIGREADRERVILSRVIEDQRRVMVVDIGDIQLRGAVDPVVYPEDVIFVEDSSGYLVFESFVKTLPLLSALIFAGTR